MKLNTLLLSFIALSAISTASVGLADSASTMQAGPGKEIIRNCLTKTLSISSPNGGKEIHVAPGAYTSIKQVDKSDNHIYLPSAMTTTNGVVAGSTKLSVGTYSVAKHVIATSITPAHDELLPDVYNVQSACNT